MGSKNSSKRLRVRIGPENLRGYCQHCDVQERIPLNIVEIEGQIIGNRPVGPNRMIRCEDCHVTGPYTLKEAAVLHWNKRKAP
jgi:hypothetical protein